MSRQTLITGIRYYTTDGELVPSASVEITGSRISALGKDLPVPAGAAVIEGNGLLASPGFLDLHIQGAGNACVMDGDPQSIDTICRTFAEHGTTGFLLTPIPDPADGYRNLTVVREKIAAPPPGTRILGVHLEGPFLNPDYTGAFTGKEFEKPSSRLLDTYLECCGPENVRMMTIAPELEGALDIIRRLVHQDIVAAVGHSDANAEQVRKAFALGASHITHMFNAMRPFHHREPGVAGAALLDTRVSLQIVADGYHLHPGAITLLMNSRPLSTLTLITDAMRCACMPDGGTYTSFGKKISVRHGKVTLADGTIAGSTLTLEKAVRNIRHMTGLPLPEVLKMASLYPARVVGMDHRKGILEPGYDADIVLLDDDLNVHLTLVEGAVACSRLQH